jgi:hypothetical protein
VSGPPLGLQPRTDRGPVVHLALHHVSHSAPWSAPDSQKGTATAPGANCQDHTSTGRQFGLLAGGDGRVDVTSATDLLWTLNHPDTWYLLVRCCCWTADRYEQWVGETLGALPPGMPWYTIEATLLAAASRFR